MPAENQPRVSPTPGCSFVARVAFEMWGMSFQPGDAFPYRDHDWTEDAAWNFWRSAMINVAPESAPAPVVAPAPAAKHKPARR